MDKHIYNIHEAKTNLSKIMSMVDEGQEIIIARNGKPAGKVIKYEEAPLQHRKPGALKGQIWMADDWDSPETNEAIAREFYASMGIDYDELPVESPVDDKK